MTTRSVKAKFWLPWRDFPSRLINEFGVAKYWGLWKPSHFLKANSNISRCPLTVDDSLTKLRILRELHNLILGSPVWKRTPAVIKVEPFEHVLSTVISQNEDERTRIWTALFRADFQLFRYLKIYLWKRICSIWGSGMSTTFH